MPDHSAIQTIGYEGRSLAEFVEILTKGRVTLLLDTRIRASSRKRGFSRSALAAQLAASGIQYAHDAALGTPPELMRDRRHLGQYDLERYAQHLDANGSVVERTASTIEGHEVALMCFELDPATCHRTIVADRLARLTGRVVRHL